MLLVDTGPLVAVANNHDAYHHVCLELLVTHHGPVLVPATAMINRKVFEVSDRLRVKTEIDPEEEEMRPS